MGFSSPGGLVPQVTKIQLFRIGSAAGWVTPARGGLCELALFFVVFQRVGSKILHGFSRPSDGVSGSRSLLGSSLRLLSGSCHVCIMPQATTPVLLDCVCRRSFAGRGAGSSFGDQPNFRDYIPAGAGDLGTRRSTRTRWAARAHAMCYSCAAIDVTVVSCG